MDPGDVFDSSVISRSISSKVVLLSSQITEVEEANVELRTRIAELEKALKGLRTKIVGVWHAELESSGAVNCSALCSTVLAAVASLREENNGRGLRISELERAMNEVRSSVVGGGGDSVECSVHFRVFHQ
jgi:hypothetical protein